MAESLQAGRAFVDLIPRMSAASAAAGQAQVGGFLAGIKGKAALAGAGIATALAAPLSALALFKLGDNFNTQFRAIRLGTGATGEALKGLEQSFKNVAGSGAQSFEQSQVAITALSTRTGLAGKALEDLAKTEIRLSRITKEDLGSQIAATTRLFGDWSVKTADQTKTLDFLFKVSQNTGIAVTTLSEKLVKFGAPLRQLGFTMEESATILGKFEKEGVNADLVMGSMRIALGKLARSGEPAQETFRRVVQGIKEAGSTSEANAMALELFGARAGPDMAAAIREGRFEIDGLLKTLKDSPETIAGAAAATSTFSGKLSVLKNAFAVALEPIATKFYRTVNDLASKAMPYITAGITAFANVIVRVADALGHVLGLVGSWVSEIVRAFKVLSGDDGPQGFGEIMDHLLGNSGKYVATFRNIGQGILDAAGRISDAVGQVRAFFKTLTTGFTEDEGTPVERLALVLRETLLPIIEKVSAFIGDNLVPIIASFAAVLGGAALLGILSLVSGAIGAIVSVIGVLVGVLTSPILLIAALVAGLVIAYQRFEGFRNVIDTVARFIIDVVVPAIATFVAFVIEQFGNLAAWVQTHWDQIRAAIELVVGIITTIITTAVDAILLVWHYFGDTIMSVLRGAFEVIMGIVEFAIDFIRGVIELVLAVISGDWGAAWDAIVGILQSAWDLIGTIVSAALDTVVAFIGDGLAAARDLVWKILEEIVGFFRDLPGNLIEAAGDLFGWIFTAMQEVVKKVLAEIDKLLGPLDEIAGKVGGVLGKAGGIVGKGLGMIPGLAEGGETVHGGYTLVGEDGPEILDLSAGSRVIPLNVAEMLTGAARGDDDRPGRGDGPLISIGEATFEDEVDVDMLMDRAAFAANAGRFDG